MEPLKKLPPRSGTVHNLTASQRQRYTELERILAAEPELYVEAHARESRRRRLLRHLRAWDFDVQLALKSIHNHSNAWSEIGMDRFTDTDEMRESDAMFVCGEDLFGRPLVICQPGIFVAKDKQDAINTARRCIWTLQRAVDRLGPGLEQVLVVYDIYGVSRINMDRVFIMEIVRFMGSLFPERMANCICVNVHWTMLVFWRAVQPMLSTKTQAKVQIHGTDVMKALGSVLPSNHCYLQYLLAVKGLSATDRFKIPLPRATTFVPRWHEAAEADQSISSEALYQETHRSKQVGPVMQNSFLQYFACCCGKVQPDVRTASAAKLTAEEREPVLSSARDELARSSDTCKVKESQNSWWLRSLRSCRCCRRDPRAKCI